MSAFLSKNEVFNSPKMKYSKTFLIVDDSPFNVDLLSKLVKKVGGTIAGRASDG